MAIVTGKCQLRETGILIKSGLLAVALCLVTACSASFTYNQLDWLIPWHVDDYVDLTPDQKEILKVRLRPLLDWHRYEELTRYADLLDRIEQDVDTGLGESTVRGWLDEMLFAARRIEDNFVSAAIELGESMTDRQMQEFSENLWKKQAELEEKFLQRSDEEYRSDSSERLTGIVERFIGQLEPEQERIVENAMGRLIRFDREWLTERAAWLKRLEPLLQRNPGWQQAVLQAHADRINNRPDQHGRIFEHNLAIISQSIAALLNQRSEKQDARLGREIDRLRADLLKLSGLQEKSI